MTSNNELGYSHLFPVCPHSTGTPLSCSLLVEQPGYRKYRYLAPSDFEKTLLTHFIDESICKFVPFVLYTVLTGQVFPKVEAIEQQATKRLLNCPVKPLEGTLSLSVDVKCAVQLTFVQAFWKHAILHDTGERLNVPECLFLPQDNRIHISS
jgi:hypothetical protein